MFVVQWRVLVLFSLSFFARLACMVGERNELIFGVGSYPNSFLPDE